MNEEVLSSKLLRSQKLSNQRIGVDRHFPKELGERRPNGSSLAKALGGVTVCFHALRSGACKTLFHRQLTWGRIDNTDQARVFVIPTTMKTSSKFANEIARNLQFGSCHYCRCIRTTEFVQRRTRRKQTRVEKVRRCSSTFQNERPKFQDALRKTKFQEIFLIWLD